MLAMINMLTQKQLQLLHLLLKQREPIPAEELAKLLDASGRTVIRYVNTINDEILAERVQIRLKRGLGYFLEGDVAGLKKLLETEQPEDNTARVNAMILAILYQENVTIEHLSEQLHLSVSTLNKLTVAVKSCLKTYQLELSGKPYYGLCIEGDEKDKRTLIADIGFEYHRARLINIGVPNISDEEFAEVDATAFSYLQRNGLVVADLDLNYLIVRMTIALSRCRAGHPASDVPLPGTADLHNYRVVRGILSELSEKFQIELPEDEYLYVLVYSGFMRYDFTTAEMKVDQEIHEFVKDFMKEMSEFTGSPFGQDENASRALSIHLKMLMQRAHSNQCFPNPVIEQIKSDYPVEMNYAIILANRVEEHFGIRINEDEIGYLTVHLGVCQPPDTDRKKALVLCNFGVGTSQILRERMQSELSDVNIVGVYPVRYLSIALQKEVDFIISTVPVDADTGSKPLIVEENLLGAHSYESLREKIWQVIRIQNELIDFFDPACFIQMEASDRFDAITQLSQLLKSHCQLDDDMLNKVVKRELISATDIGNLVAVPHMLSKGEFQSGIAVGILKKPILWEKEMVQLVFLACFNQADARSASVFRSLYKLVKSRETVSRIIETKDFQGFVQILNRK